MLRNLQLTDLREVERIHFESNGNSFPMPDVCSPLYCVQKAIEVNGETKGAAFVFLTSEISLILDKGLPALTRARLVKNLFDELIDELPKLGLADTHVFVLPESDEAYAEFLEKHCGFQRAPGIALYRRR